VGANAFYKVGIADLMTVLADDVVKEQGDVAGTLGGRNTSTSNNNVHHYHEHGNATI